MTPSDDELKETRAALAPTLEATAAILPWVNKPREPRYPPEKRERWEAACAALNQSWGERYTRHLEDFRPTVTELGAAALELNDVDLLALAEAFASAADALEDLKRLDEPHLVASISAACECLMSEGGIEEDGFPLLARQTTARLEQVLKAPPSHPVRTPTLERIFVREANECLDQMAEALEHLPADAYAIKVAAEELAELAEPLELDTIALLGRALAQRLIPRAGEPQDLDEPYFRAEIETRITEIAAQIDALDEEAE